jgi:hypothetical protein
VLAVAGVLVAWLWHGISWAAGFALGAVLSALSFWWMKGGVHALADLAVAQQDPEGGSKPQGGSGAIARFVLRYALIGLAGYAIFRSSALSLAAFFAGLFVAVAAILVEIAYQIFLGFRKT